MDDTFKRPFFVVIIESVLLYGAESWTLRAKQEKALDSAYTDMLRMALNVSWKDYVWDEDLCGDLPRVTIKVR